MPNATQYKSDLRIIALLVGRSGDGKSYAGASFPHPFLEIDPDLRFGGISNAINQGILHDPAGIDYEQFSPTSGWPKLEKLIEQLDSDRITNKFKYKSIGVGSVTSLSRMALNFSKQFQSGKMIGPKDKDGNKLRDSSLIRIAGPSDYNVEASAVHDFFDHLRTYPCNILVTGHTVNKWGKEKDDVGDFQPAEVIGEKLSIRDNLGENIQSYFDNVWRFSRRLEGGELKFYVEFATDLAKNGFGIPPGAYDITNKEFYPFLLELITKHRKVA